MNLHNQEEMIINNMPLVKHIASKYYTNKIGIEYEDLVSLGMMGLIDASKKYNEDKGAKFSTYASIRISSFIIDEIRKQSPVSRLYIKKISEYNKSVEELQCKLFREPSIDEVAKHMKITNKEVSNIKIKISNLTTSSLDSTIYSEESEIKLIDTIEEKESLSPSLIVEKEEMLESLSKAIDMLKEKDKLLLSLYYYEELTLKEIGLILGVSESRVSQLHSRAIVNLRNIMKELKYID